MKYWVWLILLGAGGATAYVLFSSPGDRPEKPQASSPAAEIAAENPPEPEANNAPLAAPVGGPDQIILPLDAGAKKTKTGKTLEDADGTEFGPTHGDKADADDQDERDLMLGNLVHNDPHTFRKLKQKSSDAAGAGPSSPSFVPTSASAALSAPSFSAPSTPSSSPASAAPSASSLGSFAGSSANLGGSFPAFPQSAPPPATGSTSNSVASRSQKIETPPTADKKAASLPIVSGPKIAGGTDEIIKPALPPTAMDRIPPPDSQPADGNSEAAWLDAMRIPSGFTGGLSITPGTIVALAPNQPLSSAPESQPAVLGATWKSSFEATDKPTIQILRDCPLDPAAAECDPHQTAAGGPVLVDYFYQGDRHQEDQDPESKTSFEIGTTVIGSTKDQAGKDIPQSEVAFHIAPGFVPGKYQVVLFTKTTKLTGLFEVVMPAAPAQASTESTTVRTPAIPQSALPSQKPPVLK